MCSAVGEDERSEATGDLPEVNEGRDGARSNDDDPPIVFGYLDLGFDEARFELRRKGFDKPVRIKPGLQANLLKSLLKARDRYLSKTNIECVWVDNGNDVPDSGRMDTEISNLRACMKVLELKIANQRGIGWRLEESSQ